MISQHEADQHPVDIFGQILDESDHEQFRRAYSAQLIELTGRCVDDDTDTLTKLMDLFSQKFKQ